MPNEMSLQKYHATHWLFPSLDLIKEVTGVSQVFNNHQDFLIMEEFASVCVTFAECDIWVPIVYRKERSIEWLRVLWDTLT